MKLASTLPVPDDQLESDSFMMYGLKIITCTQPGYHDWHQCPFAHPDEKVARRDPRIYQYTGIVCPDMKMKRRCNRGDKCPFAHNIFEYWLHPTRYRTVMCSDRADCERTFCFFAHAPEELREPEVAAHVNLGEAEQHAKHEELHEPELAAHVKPGEPVLPAKHEPHRADDTASKIQADGTIPDNLTLLRNILGLTSDIKEPPPAQQKPETPSESYTKTLHDTRPAQEGFFNKYAQQGPPSGEDSSSPSNPAVHAAASGGGGSTGAKRMREPALGASSMDLKEPLTPLQLASYLAGFAHAMGVSFDDAAVLLQPPEPPQQHTGASERFAAQPAGPFEMVKCQQSLLQTAEARCWISCLHEEHQSELPWGDADGCSSPYRVPKFTSSRETSAVTLNPFAACSRFLSTEMPADSLLNNSWGAQTPLERAPTHSWESARATFPFPYPGCDQYPQQPAAFDWGATTSRSGGRSGICNDTMDVPSGSRLLLRHTSSKSDASASLSVAVLDPLIDFRGSSLFSHAAPFSQLQHSGPFESPSVQNSIYTIF